MKITTGFRRCASAKSTAACTDLKSPLPSPATMMRSAFRGSGGLSAPETALNATSARMPARMCMVLMAGSELRGLKLRREHVQCRERDEVGRSGDEEEHGV